MQTRQPLARKWSELLSQVHSDLRAIHDHEDEIFSVIQHGLDFPPHFHESIKLLIRVYPYFVKAHSHVAKWRPLLLSALLASQDIKDSDLQTQVYRLMGETALLEGDSELARRSFETALKRAEESQIAEMIVATCTGLLRLEWFDLKNSVSEDLVGNALTLSRQISDWSLRADLHDGLAYALTRLGATIEALGHAQLAYGLRIKTGESGELGRGAWLLSTVYLRIVSNLKLHHCLEKARYFIEIAQANLSRTKYAWQYALLAYQQGLIRIEMLDYTGAKQWFVEALKEAHYLPHPQYVVIAIHSLGLAQTELQEYEEARQNLISAYNMWADLRNTYEQASTLQALGYLEYRSGNTNAARQHLVTARSLAQKLPLVSQRKYLEKLIDDTLNEL
jgi:tetratricopeptide (TPR) repeat protein